VPGAFFRRHLPRLGILARVINEDGTPPYPTVIQELKQERVLDRRCRCRIVPYLNNIVEQDHRAIKRRISASLGLPLVLRLVKDELTPASAFT
jgi:transposase, IS6 family